MKEMIIDPAISSVVFASIPILGFAGDKSLEISRDEELYKECFDNRGKMTRIKINIDMATLTLYLLQNSPSNSVLSSFVEADRINGSGSFPIIIKNSYSQTVFACATAYVKNIPSISFGSENSIREWVVRASNVSIFI